MATPAKRLFRPPIRPAGSEGNYHEYEEDRKRRLGDEAEQPHRVKYRKLVRK